MKTIGLLGGMSWESTLEYYRVLNEGVQSRLGGLHSAKIVMHSVDFGPIEANMRQGAWDDVAANLIEGALGLEKAGADFFLICTNTMHKLAPIIKKNVSIPLLHIVDPTAKALIDLNIKKVGLLGTSFTMEEDFYSGRLLEKYGVEAIIPGNEDRKIVNSVIFKELCCGKVLESSQREYIRIINLLQQQGAQGIILGCTEIGLLVKQEDVAVHLFDTAYLHAARAVELALED